MEEHWALAAASGGRGVRGNGFYEAELPGGGETGRLLSFLAMLGLKAIPGERRGGRVRAPQKIVYPNSASNLGPL